MKPKTLPMMMLALTTAQVSAQSVFTKVVDPTNPVTTFTTAGIYKGASWVDFDNDGDVDLFAAPNRLFRNDGNGIFVQLIDLPFVPIQNPGGASFADLDQDGDLDCIVAQNPSGVFINDGAGNFTDITGQVPGLANYPSWGCSFGNMNNDAHPDFVFAHAANFHTPGPFPSKLYLNTSSSLNPMPVSGYALTDSIKPFTVPYWSDYDLDGDMDLFVATGPGGSPGPDFCYKNLKKETGLDSLQRMTSELFAMQLQDGQCYNFIDFDHDQDLDLCLTNYAGAKTRFYTNDNGVYVEQQFPFTTTNQNLTNAWGDYDNDGDQDVLITADNLTTRLYLNDGMGGFANAVSLGVAGACGIANGDYDNDGDLDLFIHGNGAARALFRNDQPGTNNWVMVKCEGNASGTTALGTIIRIKATINGNSYWQIRELSGQNSFQSQHDMRFHFGLGNASVIDSMEIRYPSGAITTLTQIAVNTLYCHIEGGNTLCLLSSSFLPEPSSSPFNLYPNPADTFISVRNDSTVPCRLWEIIDINGKVWLQLDGNKLKNDSIDISSLPCGNYLVRALMKNKVTTSPFVKCH
jgi:hypothetical protein